MVSLIGIIYGVFIFFMLIFIGFVAFKIWRSGFNYKVRIKHLTSDNTKITRDVYGKAKIDKDKVPYLTLYFGLKGILKKPLPGKMPMPPAEVKEYDTSGKLNVSAYYDTDRGYIFTKDGNTTKTLDSLSTTEGFRPFPSNQRSMMINQIYKRDAAKPKSIGEIIVYMTPFIALVMILTVFLIFYGKAISPTTDRLASAEQFQIEWQQKTLEITNKQDALFKNIVNYERGEPLEQVITSPEGT